MTDTAEGDKELYASGRQVLVTGGLGFVGSHLVDALIQRGHRVRVFDNLDPQVHSSGDLPAHTHPDAEVQRGDVRDPDALKRALDGMEVVFHEAAVVGVGQLSTRFGATWMPT